MQELIEAELTAVIGAGRYQRTDERTVHRNGHRPKTVTTAAGDVEVQVPKLRAGSFFPTLLERRRRIDRALHAVIMEAYVHGVSTRNVDDLVKAMGSQAGISKSEVSRICAGLDEEITRFRERILTHTTFPYVFLDATFCKVRVGAHVTSQALVVAIGVSMAGTREVLGTAVGDSESYEFWTEFLRSLKARGLAGVHLVTSDAHAGLKRAISEQFTGAGWQRGCTSCATSAAPFQRSRCRQSWPRSRRSSRTRIPTICASSGTRSPSRWPDHARRSPRCSTPPKTTCWRSWRSHPGTG
ncbi:hypothetical protein MTP03_43640 [Tsukamurella sp. PLM1]|nr:hypothetical protein MTP03_43640 [Tsukamurella sp. PLM1]